MVTKRIVLHLFFLSFLGLGCKAQEAAFYMSANPDTVFVGQATTIQLIMENIDGHIDPPDWDPGLQITGSNFSSQTEISGSDVRRTERYTYYLVPTKEGAYTLRAHCKTKDKELLETSLNIIVLPNPNQKTQKDALGKHPKIPKRSLKGKRKISRL